MLLEWGMREAAKQGGLPLYQAVGFECGRKIDIFGALHFPMRKRNSLN